jgi:hypothetical protein
MKSLTTLIHEADADDPLARTLEAILDSGLIVFSRDTEGRFVQLSEVLTDRAGIIADPGTNQPRNLRVFDENGRLLPGSEYPAAVVRMTGTPQRELHRRLVSDDGRQIWLKMSAVPLERGPEGWSVLTLGTDVTELHDALGAGKREIAARGALLQLGQQLAGRQLPIEDLAAAFHQSIATLLPGSNAFAVERDGDEYITTTIVDAYGHPLPRRRGRFMAEQRERWTAERAHVNLDVQDTDIYGANVVAELTNPVRSLIVAPWGVADEAHLGALVAFNDQPDAFGADQVASFEIAGRMFGTALDIAEPLARAS